MICTVSVVQQVDHTRFTIKSKSNFDSYFNLKFRSSLANKKFPERSGKFPTFRQTLFLPNDQTHHIKVRDRYLTPAQLPQNVFGYSSSRLHKFIVPQTANTLLGFLILQPTAQERHFLRRKCLRCKFIVIIAVIFNVLYTI